MKTSTCPACGAPISPDVSQCPYCQQYLQRGSLPPESNPSPGPEMMSDFEGVEGGLWVVFTIPEDGETEADPTLTAIEVVFSQTVKQNSWSFVMV